ncbi:MAG: gluconate 2-dehydrogenase subunit 3 family protein [Flavobacteriaceae bacterium]|nr:gluconate 2-dehydrogenase subunit 3 family protein [Flavobacteriaceae bacterium]
MNRRNALKSLGFVAGGILLFPSCDYSDEKVSTIINKLKTTSEEEKLVTQLVGTILPETDIPGGVSLKAQNFIWVIIDDSTSKKNQNAFMNGLRMFHQKVRKNSGKKFDNLNSNEKLNILQSFIDGKNTDSDLLTFLCTTKRLAISGYMNSEYILTEQMPYKLVPGAFTYETCKSIDNTKKINIHG